MPIKIFSRFNEEKVVFECSQDSLSGADLREASLGGAYLSGIEADLRSVLRLAPNEIPGLLAALREGRVDGSVYTGVCACLVGTLANLAHKSYQGLPGITPDPSRPAERWFMATSKGDAPSNSQICAITEQWVKTAMEDFPVEGGSR